MSNSAQLNLQGLQGVGVVGYLLQGCAENKAQWRMSSTEGSAAQMPKTCGVDFKDSAAYHGL